MREQTAPAARPTDLTNTSNSPAGTDAWAIPIPYAHLLIAAGLFVAALLFFVLTLAPSVVAMFDDSLEFQLVTYQLGIAHPTGYPLYTLLGKFFTLLPVGNIAYRVNLMSAVFGAATVALLYLLTLQISAQTNPFDKDGNQFIRPAHLGGLISALFLAGGWVFWRQATIAEVYTLNAFFVAALLLLTVLRFPEGWQTHQVLGVAFLAGLSLTHHRTMVLLLPALVIYLYLQLGLKLFRGKLIMAATLVGLLPLLIYLYLPLRGHIGSLDGTYENNWSGFWRQVSGGGYGAFIFDNPFGHERNLTFYWRLLADQFYTPLLGIFGLIYLLWQGPRRVLLLTGVAFFSYLSFNIFYQVTDIEVFFIPIFMLWALWSGLGGAGLLHLTTRLRSNLWRYTLNSLILLLLLWGAYQQFQSSLLIATGDYTWQIHDYGLDMIQQPLPTEAEGGSTVIGILGEMTLLRYFQQTIDKRPDVETVAADLEADRFIAIEKSLSQGRAVYLTRELPGAADRWSLSAVGPLIQVKAEPMTTVPNIPIPQNSTITPEITLLGYGISRPPHTGLGPAPVRLTLFWQATAPIPLDLKVSARLLDASGAAAAVVDAGPVHFAYPTTAWRSGEIIADGYDLVLPTDLSAGPYKPLLIWYDPAQNGAEVGRVELAEIVIE